MRGEACDQIDAVGASVETPPRAWGSPWTNGYPAGGRTGKIRHAPGLSAPVRGRDILQGYASSFCAGASAFAASPVPTETSLSASLSPTTASSSARVFCALPENMLLRRFSAAA